MLRFAIKVQSHLLANCSSCFSIISCYSDYKPTEPECRLDRDCNFQLACINERCENPCKYQNPCLGDLLCSVKEQHNGKKTVSCSCPDGTISVGSGRCEPGKS